MSSLKFLHFFVKLIVFGNSLDLSVFRSSLSDSNEVGGHYSHLEIDMWVDNGCGVV